MAYYSSNAANFETPRALTETELFAKAPSVFAVTAHESRSDRFRPIPTIEIIRGLAREGFAVVGATQSRSRVEGKVNYTKHMLRLRQINGTVHKVGDVLPEVILKNANDGTSQYELMAGLFRIVCMNSLVAQENTLESLKVRHSGNVHDKVIEGTFTVIGEAKKALAVPSLWSDIKLARQERHLFASAVHEERFGEDPDGLGLAMDPMSLLRPKRNEDRAQDLWTTFNVAQENVIRGGVSARVRRYDESGRLISNRLGRLREVNGIDQNVKLNKALFTLAAKMAEYHGVKA